MPEEKPIVYILRGDDREAIEGHLKVFYESLGTPEMADMNTTRLEKSAYTLNDLRSAALAMPFLTERRLVIVEDALKPYSGPGKQKERHELLTFLDSIPASTGLALVVSDTMKYSSREKSWGWSSLNDQHWLIKWTKEAGSRAIIIDCPLPRGKEMENWIRSKVSEQEGQITPQAATLLAEYVGSNTLRASQEITKLLTYVNDSRPIDRDDVNQLTVDDRESDIFKLVDAIGSRNGTTALDMLNLLLETSDFIPIFSMIIRQFRLLIQAKEILDDGGAERDIASRLHLHPFVARKLIAQGKKFDLDGLESIYHRLLTIDIKNKTGGMPGEVALDVMIAQLTEK